MGYTTKTFRPSVVNGDVSGVIQSNASDKPFAAGDLLFDWHELTIPNRSNAIVNGVVHSYGEDGAAAPAADFFLIFAKSNNGVAPTSLGTVNDKPAAAFDLPDVLMNVVKFEGTANTAGKLNMPNLGSTYYYMMGGSGTNNASGQNLPIVIDPEANNLDGTTKIYVAGIAGIGVDFSTGVLSAGNITDNTATSITVKTIDPRRHFRVGDTVHIHDVDTALGTIASMTETNITLNAAIAGGTNIATDDEFVNDKPLTITLAFSSGKM
tara:strand:+ start:615 stop:1412 length:798 start_codon:yes stop_codon:yes gene_type:complete